MRTEIVTEPQRLAAIAGAWDALLSRCRDPQPALSPRWQLAWWEVFGDPDSGRELRALLFWDGDDRLVGLAPLFTRGTVVAPGLPCRRIELIPSGEDERDEICSEYIGIVADTAFEQRVVVELARALLADELGPWDDLLMPLMSAASPMPALLAAALAPSVKMSFRVSAACPFIPLPSTWDQYLAALDGGGRTLVRRSLRDFEAWAGGDAVLRRVETATDLEQGRRILQQLHGERWSALPATAGSGAREVREAGGSFASPRFAAFHDRLMPGLLARGELDLTWLEVRGEPIAAHYNFVCAGKMQFYQGGRRMDLPRSIRPGIVLHAHAIRRAIEAGLREYDFLAGGARYKLDLSLDSRPLCMLHAIRNPLLARLDIAADYAAQIARRLRDSARARLQALVP